MKGKASAGRGGSKAGRHPHLESAGRPTEHVPNRTEQDVARDRKKEVKLVEVEK